MQKSRKIRPQISISINDDLIVLYSMSKPSDVSKFLKATMMAKQYGYNKWRLNFENIKTVFPDACVPIAGIIDYYRQNGIEIVQDGFMPDYLTKTHFFSPLTINDNTNALTTSCLDKIWKFSSPDEISKCVNCYVQQLSQTITCEEGVLQAIEWCVNEIMDNVLQHSMSNVGYISCQVHQVAKRVAFCIYDYGQGIFNSLKNSPHAPRNPLDAISLSIKEGVTRDKTIGQGNGMWGLHNIVATNNGQLVITSCSASWVLSENKVQTHLSLPSISMENGTTTIDFQIDTSSKISIENALTTSNASYKPANLYIDKFETDSQYLNYQLQEQSSGTGTRQSGERIRIEIINLHNSTKRPILIDFTGISIISSSFADELLGKLIVQYGIMGFNQIVRLINMNSTIQAIVNRSVSQRMSESFLGSSGGHPILRRQL